MNRCPPVAGSNSRNAALMRRLFYDRSLGLYLLRDDFLSNVLPALAGTLYAEPGPGAWTVIDSGNKFRKSDERLVLIGGHTNASTTAPDPVIYAPFNRAVGRALLTRWNFGVERIVAGWFVNPPVGGTGPGGLLNTQVSSQIIGNLLYNFDPLASTSQPVSISIASNTDYDVAHILRDVGGLILVKPTRASSYLLVWPVVDGSAPNLHAAIWPLGSTTAFTVDRAHVLDLGAPFAGGQNAAATVHLTSITQTLGAEDSTNPDFTTNTAGWIANGTPVTFEAIGGRAHIVTDAAYEGFYSNPADVLLNQYTWVEMTADIEVVSGSFGLIISNTGGLLTLSSGLTGNRSYSTIGTISGAANHSTYIYSEGAGEAYVDNLSVKPLTPHPAQVATADGIFDAFFQLPASPIAGQKFNIVYRRKSVTEYWTAYIQRNVTNTAWDVRLDSQLDSGTTSRLLVTGVGNPTGLRVTADGNLHNVYTYEAGLWTKRGSEINVNLYNDQKGAFAVHSTGFTFTSFTAWPRYSREMDDALISRNLSYTDRDEFYVPQAAPLAGTRTPDTLSSGDWTITDSANKLQVYGGALQIGSLTGANDPRINKAGSPATPGRTMLMHYNRQVGNLSWSWGWSQLATVRPTLAAILPYGATFYYNIAHALQTLGLAVAASTDYRFAVTQRAGAGSFIFVDGGAFSAWTLHFLDAFTALSGTLYASGGAADAGADAKVDSIRIADLSGPLSTPYDAAVVNKTSFAQSLGSELLLNNNFASWAGPGNENPTDWDIVIESLGVTEVTEVGPGQLRGGAGSGRANFWRSGGATQVVARQTRMTAKNFYEWRTTIDVVGSSSFLTADSNGGGAIFATVAGVATNIWQATHATLDMRTSSDPADITLVSGSLKQLTINTPEVAPPDAWHLLEFSLPASPAAGCRIVLAYRFGNQGEEMWNSWVAYIQRNEANTDWYFKVDTMTNGVATSRISLTVGAVKGILVHAFGSLHRFFTISPTNVITARGSELNIAHNNGFQLVNVVHSSDFVPDASWRLTSWARDFTVEGTPSIDISSLSQAVGAEVLTDGGFENWSSPTNLTSWTESVGGTSTVNRDADAQAGSYALRIDTDAAQNVAVALQNAGLSSTPYEVSVYAKANAAGKSFRFETNVTSSVAHTAPTAGYQLFRTLVFMSNGTPQFYMVRGAAASSSLYFDSQSAKQITPMAARAANPTGVFELEFALPSSPAPGDKIMLRYRMVDQVNFVCLELIRNDANAAYDLYNSSFANAARTQINSAIGVGNPTRLRVTVFGNHHAVETYEGGLWTFRFASNNSTYNTAGGTDAVWTSGFTPARLRFWKLIAHYNRWLESA